MTWRIRLGLILLTALPLLLIPSLIAADPSPDPPAIQKIPLALRVKIEPQVLKELASSDKTTYLVYLTQQADLAAAQRIQEKLTRRQTVVSSLQTVAERSQRGIRAYLDRQRILGHVEDYIPFWAFNGLAVTSDLETLLALAARPEVEMIRANHRHQLPNPKFKVQNPTSNLQPPTSNLQSVEWNIAKVRANQVWRDFGITGRGVVVANMDTGVDWTHPALQSKYRGAAGNHEYNWFDFTGAYRGAPGDGNYHGTHTMGTIVGDDRAGNQIGMAPGAQWIAVKVYDDSGSTDDVKLHQGFQWLLAPTDLNGENPDPSKAPDVVNNSWGSVNGADPSFWPDVAAWQAAGIFPVFAAGNEGETGDGSVDSPGSFPHAVAVGATDFQDDMASFSSRGPSFWNETKPEVSAPGVDIRSSVPGGGYEDGWSGTSMATPHVVGLAALLLEANPTLTADDLESFMRYTALDLGAPGPDNSFGAGRIDAYDAVRWALGAGKLYGLVNRETGKSGNRETRDQFTDLSVYQSTGIPGAAVSGVSVAGDRFVTATDATGTYTVSVPGGLYEVTASAFGYLSATVEQVQVIMGYMSMRDLYLKPAPVGTLSGWVTEAGTGEPLVATIQVVDTPASATADVDGFYDLTLPVGSYTVEASMSGHQMQRAVVHIVEGAVTTQDFILPTAPSLLLVDADAWLGDNVTLYYQYALDQAGYLYDTRLITATAHLPTAEEMGGYDVVLWADQLASPGYIGADEALMDYLDDGGMLLVAGQDIGYWDEYQGYAPIFYADYLHADFVGEPQTLDPLVGADILEGLTLLLNDTYAYKNTGYCTLFGCWYPDEVVPADDAASPIIAYPNGGIRGLKAESSPYRVIYFGFGLETVGPRDALAQTVGRALTWFILPSLTKTVDKQTAIPGELLTYALTLSHIGEADLPGVSLTDPIPQHTAYVPNSATGGATYDPDDDCIEWSGALPATTHKTFTFQAIIVEPLAGGTIITNTATMDDGTGRTVQASAVTMVMGPDLTSSTKAVDKAMALPGETLSYTITLHNSGPVTASNASLVDPIPAHTTYVAGSASGGAAYNSDLDQIEWVGAVPGKSAEESQYAWTDSDTPGGPIYEWVDITQIGTPITGLGDDTNLGPFPIGFSFPFFGEEFTQFYLNSNGFLSLSSLSGRNFSNLRLPDPSAPANLLAIFWDDLNFASGGATYYWSNNQDTLVVSYVGVPRYAAGGPYTFQAILRADGSFTFQYQTMGEPLDEATIGIQNADRSQGLTVAHNEAYVHDGLAIHFSPPPSPIPPPTITFQVKVDEPLPTNMVITNTATLDDGLGQTLQAWATTTVMGPDLASSTKTVDKTEALAGETLTYTILLANTGSVTATGVSLVDPLPENTSYVTDSVTGGATYNPDLNRIEWTGSVPLTLGYTWTDSESASQGIRKSGNQGIGRTDSLITDSLLPSYEWVDITEIGTLITGLGDDTNVGPFPIGFSFPFYGNDFTTFRLCSNGFLSFTSSSTAYRNAPLPSGTEPFNLIAPFWDDLTFSTGGEAYYWTNHLDTLVVSYIEIPHLGGGGPYTFQVILRADGSITYQYQTMAARLDEATIGIQNADGSEGLTIAHDELYVHDQLAVLISPPPPPLTIAFQVNIADTLPPETAITNTAIIEDQRGPTYERLATTRVNTIELGGSTKEVDKSVAVPGEALTYTLTLRNTGTADATDVAVVDPIPAQAVYQPGSATGGAIYDEATNRILWSGVVPSGEQITFSFSVRTVPPLPDGTAIVNTATIDDGVHLPFTRTATTTITAPDLRPSEKLVSSLTSQVLTYTILVKNGGSGAATVALTDTLPAEVVYVPGSAWAGSGGPAVYDDAIHRLTWSGYVPVRGMATIRFAVQTTGPGPITNSVLLDDGAGNVIERRVTTGAREYRLFLPFIGKLRGTEGN